MYFTTKFYYDYTVMTGTVSGYNNTTDIDGQHWLVKGIDINADGVYSGSLYVTRISKTGTDYNTTYTYDITGTLSLSDLHIYGDKFDQLQITHSGYCNGNSGNFYARIAAEIGSTK